MRLSIITPNVPVGTRDPAATADGRRVVSCPLKRGEPIAALRCMEAQAQDCYCPSAPGALAGAEDILSLRRTTKYGSGGVFAGDERAVRLALLARLKARATRLGLAAFAGAALAVRRTVVVPEPPPPAPAWLVCRVPGCTDRIRRDNRYQMCFRHRHQNWRRIYLQPAKPRKPCRVDGCPKKVRHDNEFGFCHRHRGRVHALRRKQRSA